MKGTVIRFKPRVFPPVEWDGEAELPDFSRLPGDLFLVNVRGEEDGSGVREGDTLVCQWSTSAAPGETVVAQRLTGELIVKRHRGHAPGERIAGRTLYLVRRTYNPTGGGKPCEP